MTQEEMDQITDDIPQEIAIDQRIIPFEDDDLMAALSEKGGIYISLNGICSALGIHARSQLNRILRTPNLKKGLRKFPLKTPRRGTQITYCLLLGKVAIWLTGIDTDRLTNRVAAAKIDIYQEKLEPIATQVFFSISPFIDPAPIVETILPTIIPNEDTGVERFLEEHIQMTLENSMFPYMDLQFDKITNLLDKQDDKLNFIINLLASIAGNQESLIDRQDIAEKEIDIIDARTQHLSPPHKRKVKEAIDQLVLTTKYSDNPLSYRKIYGSLKWKYQVGSYIEISDDLFTDVIEFLRDFPNQAIKQNRLF
jgi:hypothetical protein